MLVNMDEGRKRLKHIRREPRVSITVLAADDWYRYVTLLGRVAAIEPVRRSRAIDRLSRHYTGRPYPDRVRPRVSAWIEVVSRHAWAGARPWSG